MSGLPPRLRGPRMAVRAYFPFDDRLVATGVRADWAWAMRQWDTVAAAGGTVRVVVADQPLAQLDPAAAAQRVADVKTRFRACRAAEQLVFGRVYVAGGRLPLGTIGQRFDDPLNPGRQVAGVFEQIDAWRRIHGGEIDGILLDSAPTECVAKEMPGSDPTIPERYTTYRAAARDAGYALFVNADRYPDAPGWVRDLGAAFLQTWEAGVLPYSSKFLAHDACRPDQLDALPAWWADPGPEDRWQRVHVIDDCRDATTMRTVAQLAIQRGAGTIMITRSRPAGALGAVFDTLPAYWDDAIAFFRVFVDQEEAQAKQAKDSKDSKDGKDSADNKAEKDGKDSKDDPDKSTKDGKDNKDGKDEPDQIAKDEKDGKDWKDTADKGKEEPDKTDEQDAKWDKDEKDSKEEADKIPEFLKDSELPAKALEAANPRPGPVPGTSTTSEADPPAPVGRTFIRPAERPAVGARVVAEDPDPDPDGGPGPAAAPPAGTEH